MATTVRPRPANYDPTVEYYRASHYDKARGGVVYDDTGLPFDQENGSYQMAERQGRLNPDGSYNYDAGGHASPTDVFVDTVTLGHGQDAKDLLSNLDPAKGNETLAAAYRVAQQQAGALADLQWSRQMEGLQGALGHVGQQQSLWNSVYGAPAGGGGGGGSGPPPGPTTSQSPLTRPGYDGRPSYPNYAQNPPNTNPDIQKIFDDLNARGGPGAIPTTQGTFAKPDPTTGLPVYQMPQQSSNPMIAPAPPPAPKPSAPSGVSGTSSALTVAPPQPSAQQAVNNYLAAPTANPYVAPAAPPPMMAPQQTLPGLADFLPQPTTTTTSPLRKLSGWGGF